MKKYIFAFAAVAVASAALAGTASADVPRYQETTTTTVPTTTTTTTTKATFSVTQPAGAVSQWDNLWTHDYEVTVGPDGTFTGSGTVSGADQNGPYSANETITGKFAGDQSVTLTATRADGLEYHLENAPFGDAVSIATLNQQVPWVIEMKVSQPKLTITETTNTTTNTTTDTTNYTNHGDYVSQMGGGAAAAQSPIGKPIKAVK